MVDKFFALLPFLYPAYRQHEFTNGLFFLGLHLLIRMYLHRLFILVLFKVNGHLDIFIGNTIGVCQMVTSHL